MRDSPIQIKLTTVRMCILLGLAAAITGSVLLVRESRGEDGDGAVPELPTTIAWTAGPASWYMLPPTDREIYFRVCEVTDAQLDALLASDNPRELGYGISIASQRMDFAKLLGARRLLKDERPSIPVSVITGSGGLEHASGPTTVRGILRGTYQHWFGAEMADAAEVERWIASMPDPRHAVIPFVGRMKRAEAQRHTELQLGRPVPACCTESFKALKEELAAMPKERRWLITSIAASDGGGPLLTEDEVERLTADMPADVEGAIVGAIKAIGPEPGLADKSAEWRIPAAAKFLKEHRAQRQSPGSRTGTQQTDQETPKE